MEDRKNPGCFEVRNECIAMVARGHNDVEHVIGLFTIEWYDGEAGSHILCPIPQFLVVMIPDALALLLNQFTRLNLRIKKSR